MMKTYSINQPDGSVLYTRNADGTKRAIGIVKNKRITVDVREDCWNYTILPPEEKRYSIARHDWEKICAVLT